MKTKTTVALLLITAVVSAQTTRPTTRPTQKKAVAPGAKVLKDNAPEEVKTFWDRCAKVKEAKIREAKAALDKATDEVKSAKKREEKKAAVARVEAAKNKLNEVSAPSAFFLARMKDHKPGEIGTIGERTLSTVNGALRGGEDSLKVLQVIDGKNAIVCVASSSVGYVNTDKNGKVLSHQGPSQREGGPMWVTNVDTGGWTDDAVVINGMELGAKLWRVAGTKQYATAIGSTKTVMMLEPFDLAPFIEEPK